MVDLNFPIVASGYCGARGIKRKVRWYLGLDKTLVVVGEGAMESYLYPVCPAPWGTDIRKVIVDSGIASIGSCAFHSCKELSEVVIPNSVTHIGQSAFYGCNSLSEIVIPEGVCLIDGYRIFGRKPTVSHRGMNADLVKPWGIVYNI